jgi:hypothetical protein
MMQKLIQNKKENQIFVFLYSTKDVCQKNEVLMKELSKNLLSSQNLEVYFLYFRLSI